VLPAAQTGELGPLHDQLVEILELLCFRRIDGEMGGLGGVVPTLSAGTSVCLPKRWCWTPTPWKMSS
jgi:hypothetical protein